MNPLARLFSKVFARSGLAERSLRLRQRQGKSTLTILAYHRIGLPEDGDPYDPKIISATTTGFARQIAYLCKNFAVVSADQVSDAVRKGQRLPPNAAWITFDDGYRDNGTLALPILRSYNLPATIYLVTSKINTDDHLWWDELALLLHRTAVPSVDMPGHAQLPLASAEDRAHARETLRGIIKAMPGEARETLLQALRSQLMQAGDFGPRARLFLTWEEARSMAQQGIDFGAHTHTHPILSRVSTAQGAEEIALSRQIITQQLGTPPRHFAYPNGRDGDFLPENQAALAQMGFDTAVTLIPGANRVQSGTNWFALRRVYVGSDNLDVFMTKVSGIF